MQEIPKRDGPDVFFFFPGKANAVSYFYFYRILNLNLFNLRELLFPH